MAKLTASQIWRAVSGLDKPVDPSVQLGKIDLWELDKQIENRIKNFNSPHPLDEKGLPIPPPPKPVKRKKNNEQKPRSKRKRNR